MWNGAETSLRGFFVYADTPYHDSVYTRGVGLFDYEDLNGNGQNDGEPWLGDVTFDLYIQDPHGDFQLLHTTATANTRQ